LRVEQQFKHFLPFYGTRWLLNVITVAGHVSDPEPVESRPIPYTLLS